MPIGTTRRKGGSKVFRIEWLDCSAGDLFKLICVRILGFEICACPKENIKWAFR